MKLLVNVTAEHIQRGERWATDQCPIALAMAGAGVEAPYVGTTHIAGFLTATRRTFIGPVPAEARAFMDAFDFEKPVVPITFEFLSDGEQAVGAPFQLEVQERP